MHKPNPERSVIVTLAQAASLLGRSTRTLRRFIQAELIPAPIRIGARLAFRRADLDRWIAAGCPPCPSGRPSPPPAPNPEVS